MKTAAIEDIEKKRGRVDEIEARLNAVEEVRPGEFGAVVGSGHNLCTAIVAELIEGRRDEDGELVEKPCSCRYRADPELYEVKSAVQCKRHPELRWVKRCADPERFPVECPLEPDKVSSMLVCDCLPDWILKDDPDIPDHVPILKLLEKIKPDLRFLIGEVKKLTVERNQAREITCQSCDYFDYDGELSSKYCGAPTDEDCPREVAIKLKKYGGDYEERVEELRTATADLLEMIENERLMPPSLSYFAEAKLAVEAFNE